MEETDRPPAESTWRQPPAGLTLPQNELHVWRARLDLAAGPLAALTRLLSPEEATRANRFYQQRDREQFAAAHGLLRLLVGRYTGLPPAQIGFAAASGGKPRLVPGQSGRPLHFNLAHTRDLALFAFAREAEVGVDVERRRDDLPWRKLAERFFAPAEYASLLALPEEEGSAAFFALWVGKEAYVKALGEGLRMPLRAAQLRWSAGRQAQARPEGAAGDWRVQLLAPGAGYSGAVAYTGELHLRLWDAGELPLALELN